MSEYGAVLGMFLYQNSAAKCFESNLPQITQLIAI